MNVPFDNFKQWVGQQTINTAKGVVTPTYYAWYDCEFAKLYIAYELATTIDTYPAYTQYYENVDQFYPTYNAVFLPSQCGVSTFLALYIRYMKTHGFENIGMLGPRDSQRNIQRCIIPVPTDEEMGILPTGKLYSAVSYRQVIIKHEIAGKFMPKGVSFPYLNSVFIYGNHVCGLDMQYNGMASVLIKPMNNKGTI